LSFAVRNPPGNGPDTCCDGWQEELLGDLIHSRESNREPAVLEILDAHEWALED
jgi:hypothetical protein